MKLANGYDIGNLEYYVEYVVEDDELVADRINEYIFVSAASIISMSTSEDEDKWDYYSTGMSKRYSLCGALMYPDESLTEDIKKQMIEDNGRYLIVEGTYPTDIESAGWVILKKKRLQS